MWLTNGITAGQTITFDLGSSCRILGFHLWNYNENPGYNGRGIQTATISIGASASGPWSPVTLTTSTFTEATGTTTYTGENYAFSSPQTTEFVQISIITNCGSDSYTGIGKIRFLQ